MLNEEQFITVDRLQARREREVPDVIARNPESLSRWNMQAQPHRFESEAPHERATKGKASTWCKHCAFPERDMIHNVLKAV